MHYKKILLCLLSSILVVSSIRVPAYADDDANIGVTSESTIPDGSDSSDSETSETEDEKQPAETETKEPLPSEESEDLNDTDKKEDIVVEIPEKAEETENGNAKPEDTNKKNPEKETNQDKNTKSEVQKPDLSKVSVEGILPSSFTIAEKSDKNRISSDVRKSYRKIDMKNAFSKNDNLNILESREDDAREVGTIAKDGVMYILGEYINWFYVESMNVRGYVRKEDVLYGKEADAFLTSQDESSILLKTAEPLLSMVDNEAADDLEVTVYQFEKADGSDLVAYAKSHLGMPYKKDGNDWTIGVNSEGFVRKVYEFFDLINEDNKDMALSDFGSEVTDLKDATAGDLLLLNKGTYALYLGEEKVIYSSRQFGKVLVKDLKDVQVEQIRRPDYENQLKKEKEEIEENVLLGSTVEEQCWNYFTINLGMSDVAAAGAMGNIYCESGFNSGNLEGWVNRDLGVSDEQFTAACDTGVYTKEQFLYDRYTYPTSGNASQWGYGLIQFTSVGEKNILWQNTIEKGRSISDLLGQLEAIKESFSSRLDWISNDSVEQATEDFFYYIGMCNPYGVKNGYGYEYTIPKRAAYALGYYECFHTS